MDPDLEERTAEMKAIKARTKAIRDKLDAHQGKTEDMVLKANPEDMAFEVKHREVPKEHATVKPVGRLRKRHKDRNLAMERRQTPKEQTQVNCGFRRKLALAGMKMTYHTKVAWRKGNVRNNQTRDKAGQGTSKRRTLGGDIGRTRNATMA
jgi:hypothetical protein